MDNVDFDESPFVVIVRAGAAVDDAGVARAGFVTTEALARARAGYGGAIWLAQGRVLGPPSAADSRLRLGLLSWRSRSDAEAFATELRRAQRDDYVDMDVDVDDGVYQFTAGVTASADDATHVGTESAHEIITLTPVSGKQGWIAEYNESETRDHIQHLEGFVSTSLFRDLRSERIVEYVQWRSEADLTAAFGDARFAEHMSVNSHYSDGEALLFGQRSASDGDADGDGDGGDGDGDGDADTRYDWA